jgi:OOP family OmpA-OmpF porin
MKKLFLIPALLAGSLAFAQQKYEISPMIGYDIAEGNLGIKDDGYFTGGIEFQLNTPDSKISPEFSILYSPGVDYKSGGDTSITRAMIDGVYSFDDLGVVTPFAKAGLGVEVVGSQIASTENGLFLDAGAGVKVNFTESLALKLETIYMAKLDTDNAGFADSNLLVMAGLTFSFGGETIKKAPQAAVEPVVIEEVVEIVPVAAPVVVAVVDGDDDKDGILNSLDKCPTSPIGATVDTAGCNVDNDNDGVLNAQDICPNTPLGEDVTVDGCPKLVNLNINFDLNSANIQENSFERLNRYANFLVKYRNYSAKIVGYTDSQGSASYNKTLSQKRANSVVTYLKDKGVDASQLSSSGMGEANPIADNATKEGRAENRRIEAHLSRN